MVPCPLTIRVSSTDWRIPREDLSFHTNPLSRGGQGVVHRGRWAHIEVVVKRCLRRGKKNHHRLVASLEKEGRMLTSLNHPNVVRVYGLCVSPEPMVVMQYHSDGSLQEWIKAQAAGVACRDFDAPAFVKEVVSLCRGMCMGLAYMHSQDVVHFDIKPLMCWWPSSRLPLF